MTEYDAIIVGAGILGLTTAYHIQRVKPEDNILLVDKYSTAGQGNTAKSAAMFRCFFHSKKNFLLTDSSVEFYKTIQETSGIDIKIRWSGYLWLFSEEDYRWVRPLLNQMAEKNVQFSVYDEETLADRLNIRTQVEEDEDSELMGLVNVHKGVFIPKAGSIDVDALVKFYETKFLQYGGKIKYNTNVENLLVEPHTPLGISGEPYFWQESEVVGVKTEFGALKAKKVIVAAGAWANSILNPVGIDAHIKPLKRQLFTVKAQTAGLNSLLWTKGFNREGCIPFTILPKPRVYMKPAIEEDSLWLCYGDEFPREFKLEDDPQPEESFYRYGIYQVVTKYFSQFLGSQPASSFAGLYAVNTLDGQPVVFEKNHLVTVGGASGSGIMKADALGRVAAALYLGEEFAPLHGDCKLKVSDLSIEKRSVETEKLVI